MKINNITDLLVWLGIAFLVWFIWQGLELLIEGKVVASYVDSIVAIVLTYSLFANYQGYIKK